MVFCGEGEGEYTELSFLISEKDAFYKRSTVNVNVVDNSNTIYTNFTYVIFQHKLKISKQIEKSLSSFSIFI